MAVWPLTRVRLDPLSVAPVQLQAPAAYPAGLASDKAYTPAFTVADVTAPDPVTPAIETGPTAESETVLALSVPPLLFTTVLTNVKTGATSLLLIVQLATSPAANVKLLPESAPPVQLQEPCA